MIAINLKLVLKMSLNRYAIAQRALAGCSKADLPAVLQLARCCELMHSMYRQCEDGDYDETIRAGRSTSTGQVTATGSSATGGVAGARPPLRNSL